MTFGPDGNTGGAAGDFFDSGTSTGGHGLEFDSTPAHGTLAYRLGSITTETATFSRIGVMNDAYHRFYYRISDQLPELRPMRIFETSRNGVATVYVDMDITGHLRLVDSALAVQATSTVTVNITSYCRIELHTNSVAQAVMRIYLTPDGVTPDETVTASANTAGAIDAVTILAQTTSGGDSGTGSWRDDIVAGAHSWPGPQPLDRAGILHVTHSRTDSATASDSSAYKRPQSGTDSAHGTDFIGTRQTRLEAAVASDISTLRAAEARIEAAAGSDASFRIIREIATDTGTGSDSSGTVLRRFPRTDTASGGTNTSTERVRLNVVSSATGTDFATVAQLHISVTDSGTGADVGLAAFAADTLNRNDSNNNELEAGSIHARIVATDSGTIIDGSHLISFAVDSATVIGIAVITARTGGLHSQTYFDAAKVRSYGIMSSVDRLAYNDDETIIISAGHPVTKAEAHI